MTAIEILFALTFTTFTLSKVLSHSWAKPIIKILFKPSVTPASPPMDPKLQKLLDDLEIQQSLRGKGSIIFPINGEPYVDIPTTPISRKERLDSFLHRNPQIMKLATGTAPAIGSFLLYKFWMKASTLDSCHQSLLLGLVPTLCINTYENYTSLANHENTTNSAKLKSNK